MKVIRINWKFLKVLFLLLFFLYILKLFFTNLFYNDYASLIYDCNKNRFMIKSNISSSQIIENNLKNDRISIQIKSASIHYTQIPVQLWYSTIEKAYNLGLNTIEIIIPWNLNEPYPGLYDLEKNSNDLDTFIQLVKHFNLYALVRFDPFLQDSIYDLGGLPSWLIGDLDLELRSSSNENSLLSLDDKLFGEAFSNYLKNLLPIIEKNQKWQYDGPIIGIVVSKKSKNNILTFYDENYINFIENQLYRYGIVEIILTSRCTCEKLASPDELLESFCDPNIYRYIPLKFTHSKDIHKSNLTSKFSHNSKLNNEKLEFRRNLNELIKEKKSFNFKNFHESFVQNLKSKETSYLIDKNGGLNNKYLDAKQLLLNDSTTATTALITMKNRTKKKLEINLKMNNFLYFDKLIENLEPAISLNNNQQQKETFLEYLGLKNNLDVSETLFIIYSLNIFLLKDSIIYVNTKEINDYSVLICDQTNILLTFNSETVLQDIIQVKLDQSCNRIDLIVQNEGRSSQSNFYRQRKGMMFQTSIMFKQPNESIEMSSNKWKFYFIDFKTKNYNKLYPNSNWSTNEENNNNDNQLNGPFMAYGNFNVNKSLSKSNEQQQQHHQGIYLSVDKWFRGICILNGIILTKYNNDVSKLVSNNLIFIPNFLLNQGQNDLIILEMINSFVNEKSVYFFSEIQLKK